MDSVAPASSNRPRESGFTLIELLVSLTILMGILAMLGAALRTLSQNWSANAQRIETLEMVSRAFDIFQRDVSGLQRLVHEADNDRRFIFTGTQNHLSFVTLEPPYPTAAGPYFVNYSVARNGPASELIRARAPYEVDMLTFPGATPANSVSLLQGRLVYQFSYAHKTQNGGVAWQKSWPKRDQMPDLIQLAVVDAARGSAIVPPFVAAMRTDAEIACLTQDSDMCTAKTEGRLGQTSGPNANQGVATSQK